MIRIIVHFHENVSWNASINNGWDLDDHGEYFRCIYKNPASYTVATIVQEFSGKILVIRNKIILFIKIKQDNSLHDIYSFQ